MAARICVSALSLLALNACEYLESENRPPVILELSAEPDTINTAQQSTLVCEATDADGDFLGFAWDPGAGRILGQGDSVTFDPPDDPQSVWIKCVVGDPYQEFAEDSVRITVVEAPPPPPVISLDVDARENCYKMDNVNAAHVDVPLDFYTLTPVGANAFFNPNGPYSRIFVSCKTTHMNVVDLDQSTTISNTQEAGVYAFFTDVGTLDDNSGGVTLNLVSIDQTSTAQLEVDAVANCILLNDSRAAHIELANGSYLVHAQNNNASYKVDEYYSYVYLATANAHYYRMPLAGFVEVTVNDGNGLYAFFTDTYKIGDNNGTVTLIFE